MVQEDEEEGEEEDDEAGEDEEVVVPEGMELDPVVMSTLPPSMQVMTLVQHHCHSDKSSIILQETTPLNSPLEDKFMAKNGTEKLA